MTCETALAIKYARVIMELAELEDDLTLVSNEAIGASSVLKDIKKRVPKALKILREGK